MDDAELLSGLRAAAEAAGVTVDDLTAIMTGKAPMQ